MTTRQWEREAFTSTSALIGATKGIAGGIHLEHGDGPGCEAVEYIDSFTAPGWRQCGMPVFAAVDLEHDGVQPFHVCLHHANRIAAAEPGTPIRPSGRATLVP